MAKVKFLKRDEIESATLCLLADYGRKYGVLAVPPGATSTTGPTTPRTSGTSRRSARRR